jgi:NAD(P)-dependent dehydrogenase (short-subunit alcohol dehydrogenase family)
LREEAGLAGRFDGMAVLVTGAASGIGKAIGMRFRAEGADVLFTDRDADGAAAVARAAGGMAAHLDVTHPGHWTAALAKAESAFGGLHFLVNNAGICEPATIEDLDLDSWRRNHAVNLDSVFLGCRAALPLLSRAAAQRGGRASIVNIASISAIVAGGNMASYNSSKAAVRHLTRSVALHCARRHPGVTCNAILPTFVDTPLVDRLVEGDRAAEMRARLARQIPLGRLGRPEEVAGAAAFLCSADATFITGTDIILDGGLAAQ